MTKMIAWTGSGVSLGRRVFSPFAATLLALLRNPLTRNGYALIASSAATSILGVVFWIVAARLYDARQVGIGSVMIATMITLSSASQLGFGNLLNRQLPVAGSSSGRLILTAYAAGIAASLALAVGFLLAAPTIAPDLAFIIADPRLSFWFALAVAGWTVFALQDSALAGLRQSIWVPVENTLYALIKLGLLSGLALVAVSGLAMFAAWTLPVLFMIAAVNLAIFTRVLPHRRDVAGSDLGVRRMLSLVGWDYAAGLALTAALGIAPLLVLNASGPAGSASYYLSWTITYSLYLIGRSMGISLLTEGVTSRARLRTLTADTFVHTMLPLGGAALVVAIGAPLIMALFGPTYAQDGAPVLTTLALASIPWGMVTIYLALARVQGWMRTILLVQLATLTLVVGMGLFLVTRMGPLGMGLAWLLAHTTVLIGIAGMRLRSAGVDGLMAFALDIASASARILEKFPGRTRVANAGRVPPERLAAVLASIKQPGAALWSLLDTVASYSDSGIVLVGDQNAGPPVPRAVLKFASSAEGIAALQRGIDGLAAVTSDPRLGARAFEFPSLLAVVHHSDLLLIAEAIILGRDGRSVLVGPDSAQALASAARAIEFVHSATSSLQTLDAAWVADWIDGPLTLVAQPSPVLLSAERRMAALHRFGVWQRRFWQGRVEELGRCHGDFTPGNVLFANDGHGERLSGIIDWDGTRAEGPFGFDLCQMAITTRMLAGASQMGAVVRDHLEAPHWTAEELAWLDPADRSTLWQDPEWSRAMVGLVWLRHMAANIEKSGQYGQNKLWLAANLDWVLRSFSKDTWSSA